MANPKTVQAHLLPADSRRELTRLNIREDSLETEEGGEPGSEGRPALAAVHTLPGVPGRERCCMRERPRLMFQLRSVARRGVPPPPTPPLAFSGRGGRPGLAASSLLKLPWLRATMALADRRRGLGREMFMREGVRGSVPDTRPLASAFCPSYAALPNTFSYPLPSRGLPGALAASLPACCDGGRRNRVDQCRNTSAHARGEPAHRSTP